MANDGPYAWRSARSTNGRNASVQQMGAVGRQPVYNLRGQIRGFSSHPGAPTVGQPLGIVGTPGTIEHDNAWRNFFGPLPGSTPASPSPSASAAPAMPPPVAPGSSNEDAQAYAANQPSAAPAAAGSSEEDAQAFAPTNPQDAISATVDAHSTWLKNNGIPIPPPAPAVDPAAGGYTVTSPTEASGIAAQYAPKPVVKNNWGDPLPST